MRPQLYRARRGALLFVLLVSHALGFAQSADEAWLDQAIGARIGQGGPPAAVAAVVRKDGPTVLRAWGQRRLSEPGAVSADQTVFRIGSITKSFTAIAVLQLVDEGRLKLDDEVGPLLKGVRLPPSARPTRVIDLLTHRGGFDGEISTVGLDDAQAAAASSDERLQRDLWRVREPGLISVYDNMAYGLLGQLLEAVDGRPYPEAIAARLFQPLGMQHSQIGLPEDPSHTADATEVGPDGKPLLRPQIYLRRGWRGAGDMSSTAADMSRFLTALLNEGRFEGRQLLSPAAFKLFSDTQRTRLAPCLPGTGMGAYALGRIGAGGFGHAGTIRGFNALYMVMPKEGVALFAVMNLNRPIPEFSAQGLQRYFASPPGRGPINPTDFMLFDLPDLAERHWQAAAVPAAAPASAAEDARRWEGSYAYLRAEDNEALLPRVLTALLLPRMEVRAAGGQALSVDGSKPLTQAGPGLYLSPEPADSLSRAIGFAEVEGQIIAGPHTLLSYRRVATHEAPWLTVGGLLGAPLLVLLLALLRRPVVGDRQTDWRLALGALLLLALLLVELAVVPVMQRQVGWPALVALLRLGLHGALAFALWSLARQARLTDWRARAYVAGQGLLMVWIVFAWGYWHVLGKF
ncbi:serine hydrolase domain-containing protein [Paucibacter sp. JuS9]|uniref:serine hydrolase domain-containing protein n=1 Tax=Paucibacter sp. JuS9 TaxID=3228748 RepID=UPI0037582BD4